MVPPLFVRLMPLLLRSLVLLVPLALGAGAAFAAASAPARLHQAALTQLERATGLPVLVESDRRGSVYSGSLHAILDYPYAQVAETLRVARNWCEIAPLHLNIKACTLEPQAAGRARLTFYSGRKHYQAPDQEHALAFRYEINAARPEHFEVSLVPDRAPQQLGAEPIVFQAMPLAAGRTLLHVRFTQRSTLWTRMAAQGYFATLGNGKVGFSVTGTDRNGRPVYVDGVEGAIERNAVRYYLALQAFLATQGAAAADRFQQRLNRWFDLTEQYRPQLHEMDKDAYLDHKRREREQQLRLQRAIDGRA